MHMSELLCKLMEESNIRTLFGENLRIFIFCSCKADQEKYFLFSKRTYAI